MFETESSYCIVLIIQYKATKFVLLSKIYLLFFTKHNSLSFQHIYFLIVILVLKIKKLHLTVQLWKNDFKSTPVHQTRGEETQASSNRETRQQIVFLVFCRRVHFLCVSDSLWLTLMHAAKQAVPLSQRLSPCRHRESEVPNPRPH